MGSCWIHVSQSTTEDSSFGPAFGCKAIAPVRRRRRALKGPKQLKGHYSTVASLNNCVTVSQEKIKSFSHKHPYITLRRMMFV